MPPPGGLRTSLSFSVSGQAGGGWNAAFQPNSGVFSPGLPLVPPQPQPTRLFDFPVGLNTQITPRSGFADIHSFASLRAFSEVEPVRLAIETCKDQVERLDWKIKTVDGKRGKGGSDSRIQQLTKFFRKPDGCTPFATWLRESLEDLLVIDAPAFEKRRDRGGRLIGLDVVPGDTIKLLVDETGRRPRAPLPAFQQIIKGIVWNDLTTDELIYTPRNPRPNRLYGFSPVEQIIVTVNTVIRRQSAQLGYFTEGNVPAGILNVPEGWGPDQIKTMQDAWDARMEGYLPGKSKLQWVPDGTKYQAFKESPLKDEFDEWLYRIVCFAFSLPPTAFIKQMNRATAQQGAESGKEEGIESRKLWWKRVADDIIQEEFGYADLEWGWNEDVEVDPVKQAQIDDLNLRNGSTYINEVRDARGQDTVEGGDEPLIYLPTGPVVLKQAVEDSLNPPEPPVVAPPPGAGGAHPQPPGQVGEDAPKPSDGEEQPNDAHTAKVASPTAAGKLEKATSTSIDRPLVRRAQARAKRTIARALKHTGDDVAAQVEQHLQRLGKAADDSSHDDFARLIAGQVDLGELFNLDIGDDLAAVAKDSAASSAQDVGADSAGLTNQIHSRAVDWAKSRAAQLVSVQGPANIVEPTRDMIRRTIADGLAENIGSAAIAERVQTGTAFSEERADRIAKHEIASANEQGKLAGWREAASAGISLKKGWQTSNNGNCCDECQDNADAGLIGLDEDFPSGDSATPAHPGCECVTYAEVAEQDDAGDGDESEDS